MMAAHAFSDRLAPDIEMLKDLSGVVESRPPDDPGAGDYRFP
jgi:hypothetical protein